MIGESLRLSLAIAGATVAFTLTSQAASLQLQRNIPNPSPDSSDLFGQGVAISGGVALVGATTDGTTSTGSGQAYLFNAATGTLLHTLPNPGTAPTDDDHFGLSVSLAGNLALVGAQNDDTGATNSGQAYLFNVSTGALLRTFTNPSPGVSDNFGQDVAIDNGRALISAIADDTGASNAGAAYLFDTTTGALLQMFNNPVPGPTSGDNFGYAVALFGNRALISTINDDTAELNAGAAYLFDTTTGALLRTFLNPTSELNNTFGNNDNFGFDVALSGTKALIGSPNDNVNGFHNGATYLYDVATGALLNTLLIPTPNSDTEEFLGSAVALSDDFALAGAPFRNKGPATSQKDLGAAFLFNPDTGAFLQELNDPSPVSNDRFGFAVALDGDEALVGAQTDLVGTIRPGQVFYYSPVPEPGTLALLGLGAVVLLPRRRIVRPVAFRRRLLLLFSEIGLQCLIVPNHLWRKCMGGLMQSITRVALFFAVACFVSNAYAAERFTNGDFEAGVSGFDTDYTYNGVDNTLAGQFAVTSSPNIVHGSWGIFDDHTIAGTLMMTANGSTTAGMAVWRETVSVVPGADYTFSAWGASNFSANPALLSFRANDVEFATLQLPSAVGVWTNGTAVVNAGANSSIEFEIVDLSIEGFGNDLALDDISLDGQVPVPEPCTLLLCAAAFTAALARSRSVKRRSDFGN